MSPDLDERIETYYVRVRGTVQGVGFRHADGRIIVGEPEGIFSSCDIGHFGFC